MTDVLNKVTAGQADAGLVYVTDAASAGDKMTAVAFPEAAQAVNTYPLRCCPLRRHRTRRRASSTSSRDLTVRLCSRRPDSPSRDPGGARQGPVRASGLDLRPGGTGRTVRRPAAVRDAGERRLVAVLPAGHVGILTRGAGTEPADRSAEHRAVRPAGGFRWRQCCRAAVFADCTCCGRWCSCRWCFHRWSGGIALLYTFGRKGLIGQHLEVAGIHIAFTTTAWCSRRRSSRCRSSW